MSLQLFGTDGIRGPINASPLLPHDIARLGLILGSLAGQDSHIAIGRDTRASGLYLESALVAGINAAGVHTQLLGIMPTACVASIGKKIGAYFSVMISASHNSHTDNGLKIFGPDGFKITPDIESTIESEFFASNNLSTLVALKPGITSYENNALAQHLELLKNLVKPKNKHMRIVIDCAHGAASYLAPEVFSSFGDAIKLIGCAPNGHNINRDFGSEFPRRLQEEVVAFNADLGIAFDGDADRVIFADERGELIDGDAILALLALYLKQQNLLKQNTLVATVMSSLALDKALAPHGILVERTEVGDKFVARHMIENSFSFGGENSGHLIIFPLVTTGDGTLSALKFLEAVSSSHLRVSELLSFYEPTPRILKNIQLTHKIPLENLPRTQEALKFANKELTHQGRAFLRYSGTENKARLLVEALSADKCHLIADNITRIFCNEISDLISR